MAALRLVRKWGIPLATGASVPLLVPVVAADSGKEKSTAPTSRMVRPSDLPIYEEPEEVLDFEYHGRERTSLEEGVGVVRKEVEGVLEATRSARERVSHIYETGKAHSMATIDYLTDEENMLPRAGAITVGGLTGLVIGRRGGFFKKLLYTSTGALAAASLCYPRQAYLVSQQAYGAAKDYGAIGYNFVVGVKPQSKASTPPPPAKKEAEEHAAPPASTPDTSPPPASAPEPEGVEVRSDKAAHLHPPDKSLGLLDSVVQQTSDVTLWGFRLINRRGDSSGPSATPSQVPEGFGSVADIEAESCTKNAEDVAKVLLPEATPRARHPSKGAGGAREEEEDAQRVLGDVEALLGEKVVGELVKGAATIQGKVVEVEEKVAEVVNEELTSVLGEKVTEQVKKFGEEVFEPVAYKVAEVAAGVVEEKVAPVVVEAAKEVEKSAATVSGVAEVVEEVGSKVGPALGVAERITEAAAAATTVVPGVPETEVEKVEETKKVVDTLTLAAKEVKGVTEEVQEDAAFVESQASELMESEEKRKEVFKEVVGLVTGDELHLSGPRVEEPGKSTPPPLPTNVTEPEHSAATGEAQEETGAKDVVVAPVEPSSLVRGAPSVERPPVAADKGGLFGKLVNFFSKESEKMNETQTAAPPVEKSPDQKVEMPVAEVSVSALDSEPMDEVKSEVIGTTEPKVTKETEPEAAEQTKPLATETSKHEATKEAGVHTTEAEAEAPRGDVLGAEEPHQEDTLHTLGEALEPVMEEVAKEVVVEVGKGTLAKAAEVVKDSAEEVKEALSEVMGVEDNKGKMGDKVISVSHSNEEATKKITEPPEATVTHATKSEIVKEVSAGPHVEEPGKTMLPPPAAKITKPEHSPATGEAQEETGAKDVVVAPVEPSSLVRGAPSVERPPVAADKGGLFGKLVNFFSKESKKISEAQTAAPPVEKTPDQKVEMPVAEVSVSTLDSEPMDEVKSEVIGTTEPKVTKETEPEAAEQTKPLAIETSKHEATKEAGVHTTEAEAEAPRGDVLGAEEPHQEDTPCTLGEALEPVMEEVVVEVGKGTLAKAAEVVKDTVEDVKEAMSDVIEVADIVEEVGDKVISVLDAVQEATEKVKESPGVTFAQATKAEIVQQISEGAEVLVEAVTFVAEKVEDVAEVVKEEAMEMETRAAQLIRSEEQRRELAESIVELVTGSEVFPTSEDSGLELATERPTEPEKESSDLTPMEDSAPAMEIEPEREGREGLVNKLLRFFSKKEEEKPTAHGSGESFMKPESELNAEGSQESLVEVAAPDTKEQVPEGTEEPVTDTPVVEVEKEVFQDTHRNILSQEKVEEKHAEAACVEAEAAVVAEAPADEAAVQEEKRSEKPFEVPLMETYEPADDKPQGTQESLSNLSSKDDEEEWVFVTTDSDDVREVPASATASKIEIMTAEKSRELSAREEQTLAVDTPPVEKESLFEKISSMFLEDTANSTGQSLPVVEVKEAESVILNDEQLEAAQEVTGGEHVEDFTPPRGEQQVLGGQEKSPLSSEDDAGKASPSTLSPAHVESSTPLDEEVLVTVVPEISSEIVNDNQAEESPKSGDAGGSVATTKQVMEAVPAAPGETTPPPSTSPSSQVQSSLVAGAELGELSSEVSSAVPESSTATADTDKLLQEVGDKAAHDRLPEKSTSTEQLSLSSTQGVEGLAVLRNSDQGPHEGVIHQEQPSIDQAESLLTLQEAAKNISIQNTEDSPSRGTPVWGNEPSITSQGNTFTVRAGPNRPGVMETSGESSEQAGEARVLVQPSWSRAGASVTEEGKDIIVQLPQQPTEKDYGQGSPEDSDMYTTRS